jgi:phenol 2-monooxygenase
MNVSMQDAFNLGWKLAAVLEGWSPPDLLQTYSAERQAIAKELIEFDREWAHMLSAPLKTASNPAGIEPEEVQEYFVRSGRYTAGTASRYDYSTLTAAGSHQSLAHGFQLGTRFHSAPVIRLGDAKVMQIGHAAKADGRWRLYVFAGEGDSAQAGSPVAALCEFLIGATTSPLNVHTRTGADIDSVIDIRAVFQLPHRQLSIQAMPPLLLPAKGLLGLRDYEKVFCAIQGNLDIYSLRGIDRIVGCMVVVRPDQFVGAVLPLDACSELTDYFSRLLIGQADATDSRQASS